MRNSAFLLKEMVSRFRRRGGVRGAAPLAALLILSAALLAAAGCKGLPIKMNSFYTESEFEMVEKSAGSIGLGFGYDSRGDINYFFFKQALDKNLLDSQISYKVPEAAPAVPEEPKEPSKKGGKKGAAAKAEPEVVQDPAAAYRGAFAEALASYDDRALFYYYMKAYYVYEMTIYMTDYYKRHKNWRLYNQFRLDYHPAAVWYMKFLDAYVETNRPAAFQEIVQQKDDAKRDAILEFQKRITITDEY